MIELPSSLKGKAILAPMAGVNDIAFRELCKNYGAAATVTEFVSAAAITRNSAKTFDMIKKYDCESPSIVQIFGSKIDELVETVKQLESHYDIIDLNCGCPVPKVHKVGAGSKLLEDPQKIYDIVISLTKATNKPITVKIRLKNKLEDTLELVKLIEKAGASYITVHGRTTKQGYSGTADWNQIIKIKESISIPVIGNGDITTPEEFQKYISKVDAIMIGRSAMSNPYIFKQIIDFQETSSYKEPDKLQIIKDYFKLVKKHDVDFKKAKFHAMHFSKGLENSATIRKKVPFCNDESEIFNLFKTIYSTTQ